MTAPQPRPRRRTPGTGQIQRRKGINGKPDTWRVVHEDEYGKTIYLPGFETYEAAAEAADLYTVAKRQREKDGPLGSDRVPFGATFGQALEILDRVHNFELPLDSPSADIYRRAARRRLLPYFENTKLTDIDEDHVRSWQRLLERGDLRLGRPPMAGSSIQVARVVLNKVFDLAKRDKILRDNPAKGLKVAATQETDHVIELTPEDVWDIANTVDPRTKLMILLMGFSGLRIGEVLGLRVDHVIEDHAHGTWLMIRQQVGAGKIVKRTKTKASRRKVPVSPDVDFYLQDHLNHYLPPEGSPADRARLLFHNRGRIVSERTARRWLVKAAEQLWPDERDPRHDMKAHALRHAAITFWSQDGIDPRTTMAWSGHTSTSFNLGAYGFTNDRGGMEKLEKARSQRGALRLVQAAQ